MRILAIVSLASLLCALTACGGGSSTPSPATSGALTGNWQMNLVQEEPRPQTPLSVSGFLEESSTNEVSGSVQAPPVAGNNNCGGVSVVSGTVTGQNVTLSINEFGTTLSFSGTVSSDGKTMSGDYQGPGGACFTTGTSGTWTAFLIPPLTGAFTGTFNSLYEGELENVNGGVPVTISGTLTQASNVGTSSATVTGTINAAAGYPCFVTASVSGTISGQNAYLNIFGYNGVQIGTLGSSTGGENTPAIISAGSSGTVLSGLLNLTSFGGPCPSLNYSSGSTTTSDSGTATLTF